MDIKIVSWNQIQIKTPNLIAIVILHSHAHAWWASLHEMHQGDNAYVEIPPTPNLEYQTFLEGKEWGPQQNIK